MSGKLIIIEGVDHLGKSEMTNRFIKKHADWIYQHQPDDSTPATKYVRQLVKSEIEMTPLENQLLHAWSHCFHYRHLKKILETKNVLLDRFYLSAFAYGAADGLSTEIIEKLEKEAWADLPINVLIYFYSEDLYPKWMKKDKSTLENARYENKGDDFRRKIIEMYEKYIHALPNDFAVIKFNVDSYSSIEEEFIAFETIIKNFS